ncbi:Sec-independent protein translocase subunit TatB [Nocardioides mangrovicus]|uniref:Sec-independent protein translocase subunit TatB n=1 Tax=Nocardioides mangrovicus TaxID=2478913 RepID=A0A3L8P765_9ACTN|nr:sec-independent translocase [Nocardioides mangrovicus]RLV50837.1 Sec-independent protein translocase subunit TatB [Nocardioides mangrovicus]
MLDVGLPEIGVILVVAVIVFGPERLPEFARQAARMLHAARTFARNAQQELRDELGPDYADLNLRDLDPRVAIRQQVMEALSAIEEEERQAKVKPGHLPLLVGETPPYDTEAT